jgi:hypothetical protein
MRFKQVDKVKTAEEARQIAIDYQQKAAKKNLSYGEIAEGNYYFEKLGEKFNLTKEFKENGII